MDKYSIIKTFLIFLIVAALIGSALMVFSGIRKKGALASSQNVWLGVENMWLGIETMELTTAIIKQYNIHSHRGLLVTRVFRGSSAESAGVMKGDVIRRWNGVSITNHKQFQRLIQKTTASKKIKFTIDRDGVPILIYAKLGIRPGNLK